MTDAPLHMSPFRFPSLFLIAGLLVGGVACKSEQADTGPPPATRDTSVFATLESEEELPRLEEWADRLATAREVGVFGRLEAEDLNYVIGEVAGVRTDPQGNVLILDEKYHDLKVFDSSGRHFLTVGRAGRGPGEFLQPLTLDWLFEDILVVTDGTRRGQLFERMPDGSLVFNRTFPTLVGVEGSCVQKGHLWVHGIQPGMDERVHRIDIDKGEISGALAPSVPEEHPILRRRRALGFIACSPDLDLILVSSRYFPEMQAFGFDGTARWEARIEEFTPMEFTLVAGGGLRQGIAEDAGGFHWIVGAVFLDPYTVAVQVGWQTIESSGAGLDYAGIVTYLVSGQTGESLRVEAEIPLIHQSYPSGFLASSEDPFPRVLRYEFEGSGK